MILIFEKNYKFLWSTQKINFDYDFLLISELKRKTYISNSFTLQIIFSKDVPHVALHRFLSDLYNYA